MALEILSTANLNFYAPRFEVEIEDKRLAMNISKQILNVQIEEKLDEGASFTFTLNDEFDMMTRKFKWLDDPLFKEGNKVGIKMGYGASLYSMIMGKITSISPSFFSGEIPSLTLGGQDLAYDYIKRTSPEKTFIEMKYGDIARQIAADAGLLPVVDDTGIISSIRKKSDETYYAFLKRLSVEAGGYELNIEGQAMYFVKPKDDKKEILTLNLGKDIISFSPRLNTSRVVTEVEVRAHNPQNPSQPIIGRAATGTERSQESGRKTGSRIVSESHGSVKRVITNVIATSVEHANSMARAKLNESSDGLIEGEGECIGIPQIRTGVNIRLDKMGEKFSGKYYVKGTTHTINGSGYRTRFSVKRNAI